MKLVFFITLLMLTQLPVDSSAQSSSDVPKNLEECLLKVALNKTNADMAYLAKEICERVYLPKKVALFVDDPKTGLCEEWWFDDHGHYENATLHCMLESENSKKILACQDKQKPTRYFVLELQVKNDTYVRSSAVVGYDPGAVYKTLAACVIAKSRP